MAGVQGEFAIGQALDAGAWEVVQRVLAVLHSAKPEARPVQVIGVGHLQESIMMSRHDMQRACMLAKSSRVPGHAHIGCSWVGAELCSSAPCAAALCQGAEVPDVAPGRVGAGIAALCRGGHSRPPGVRRKAKHVDVQQLKGACQQAVIDHRPCRFHCAAYISAFLATSASEAYQPGCLVERCTMYQGIVLPHCSCLH